MKNVCRFLAALFALSLLFTLGCQIDKTDNTDDLTLKISLMPAVDSAPFLLAAQKGYFAELGLDVEIEIFMNAQNRQSALQANAIDGAMTDLVAVATNVDSGFDIKAIMMTSGSFAVLANPESTDMTEISVATMEVSVTNYLTDRYLTDDYTIEKVFIDEIPQRLVAIQNGQVDMGLFPEPVASMGELSGLNKSICADYAYSPDVMAFTGTTIENKAAAIALFIQAYNKAVDDIAADPDAARDILIEQIPNLQPEVRDMIALPDYAKAMLPDKDYIQDIIDWTANVVKKDLAVDPDSLVDRSFINP